MSSSPYYKPSDNLLTTHNPTFTTSFSDIVDTLDTIF
uniref:Uncharacterized protein n=1 Tax=Siphoviridae sp. ct43U4 TaxID=2826285 RepID=A0A8S5N0H6_9CAUD|nr:MAG TPA: hypothetical protein [Siphoviridae sp. ct43U4]